MSYFIENIFICLAAQKKEPYIHRFGNARLHRFGIS